MSGNVRYRWRLLHAGPLRLDGGGMFGIVPRAIWNKLVPCDDQGRIELAHNCLLLECCDKNASAPRRIVVETGSGNKFPAKQKSIYGLSDRWLVDALQEIDIAPEQVGAVVVTHLHFDHAGGLTRLGGNSSALPLPPGEGTRAATLTFPQAPIFVQRREWDDAIANRSTMTRTYLKDNLEPLRPNLRLLESPAPFPSGYLPQRDELPNAPVSARQTEILPGISVFIVPGHTWAQQAISFTDDRDRTVVFSPDIIPTIHHVGAAYNMAYDVEPFTSTVSRHWFLDAAMKNDWLLVLDHEPGNPCQRVRSDGNGWYVLQPETGGIS